MALSISLNPGFILLAAALFLWATPQLLRMLVLPMAAIVAMAAPFAPAFGDHAVFGQFGLTVVPLRLDALSQMFGLSVGAATLMVGMASSVRNRRGEDALICLLGGGALTAVFAGDLVTLVAGLSLAAFAVCGLSFLDAQTVEARAAARRILVWMALAVLLLTAGAGVFLGEAKSVRFDQIGADNFGGVLVLLGLLILLGAPGAHVWLRDAAVRLSPTAAALALTATPLAALFGFARGFAGEPALAALGIAMALGAGPLALAADDLRRSLAYVAVGAWGAAAALMGLSAPQALAGASALAFMTSVSLAGVILAAGAVFSASGTASARRLAAGLGRAMPLTVLLCVIAGLSLAGLPGLGGHVARAFAFDAAADFGAPWVWPSVLAAAAVLMAAVVMRLGLVLASAGAAHEPGAAAPEPPLLALAFGFAVTVWVGLSPDWLLALTPPEPFAYNPYRLSDVLAAIQVLAGGAAAWGVARLARVAPLGGDPPDLDVLWRAPYPAAARFVAQLGAYLAPWLERRWSDFWIWIGRFVDGAGQVLTQTRTGGASLFMAITVACFIAVLLTGYLYWRMISAAGSAP